MRTWCALLTCVLIAAAATTAASAADESLTPVTVNEPAGLDRSAWPASGGIPFKPGQVKDVSNLTLVDAAGKPVAAQFSKLAGYADGSVQWALVDVLADVPANGKTGYAIRLGSPAKAAQPLKIDETADAVTIDTGSIQLTVNKKTFGLFDRVSVAGQPIVSGSKVSVIGGKGRWYVRDAKTKQWTEHVDDSHEGKSYQPAAPTRVSWEYRGELRATLRVDGDFVSADGKDKWLSYTARITAWAGSGLVRVRFALRNSNPAEGNDAFIARAPIALDLAVDAKNEAGGLDWSAGGDGKVGVMVQDRHTAGIYWGPGTYLIEKFSSVGYHGKGWDGLYGQKVDGRQAVVEVVSPAPPQGKQGEPNNGKLGFTRDGVFALADRSHKESEVWFDFYKGSRDQAAHEARAKSCRSKLLVTAPGEWYSDTETFSVGHFGTLADEIAVYKQWGWKGWDDEKKYPRDPHQPFAFVPAETFHETTEDDAVQGYLLQFLRTGERGFFDWGEAYNGLYRGHAIYRTDWGEKWATPPAPAKRENKGQYFQWYGPHVFEWADTRMHNCHHYGRGIFDYYCLTGDTDSLEAGLDLAEEMTAGWDKKKPSYFTFSRAFGRQFLTALRAYQLTRSDKWKAVCDAYAAQVLEAKNWQPELNLYHQSLGIKNSYFAKAYATGHFDISTMKGWEKIFRPIPPKLDKYLTDNKITAYYDRGNVMARKGEGDNAEVWEVTYLTQLFELSACHMALERYAVMFDSQPMRQRVIDVANGVGQHYWSPVVDYMIGSPWFSWPDKNKTLDPYAWSDNENPKISGYATRYTADMFARAYGFSKDPKHLELAKRSWDRGSKRGYETAAPMAGPDEVGEFAYVLGSKSDTILECSARLFYVARPQKKK